MALPAIPQLTYKYWLFKNKRKDSYEAFEEYYRQSAYQETAECSFSKMPKWMQDATIKEAFKWRFINNLY